MTKIGHNATESRRVESERNGNQEFWALKDVCFDVQPGEVVGIIGHNGAGKSTLLKLLTRITEPTSGEALINGRVGSLLEVGTGFHPELTGRENIYMNGTILGMKKPEIQRKFDEIVSFSELNRFIDTPVKRYSSGMYVRLAFAVAAHLEPEIMLVDEVLAVGDAAFQKRCLGKMKDVANCGRTVLFVSHSMAAIESLCQRVILLDSGLLIRQGMSEDVIGAYLQQRACSLKGEVDLSLSRDRTGHGNVRIVQMRLTNMQGLALNQLKTGMDCVIELIVENAKTAKESVVVTFRVHDHLMRDLFQCRSDVVSEPFECLPGRTVLKCAIPRLPLQPGLYSVSMGLLVNREVSDKLDNAVQFNVEAGDFYKTGRLPNVKRGNFLVDYSWFK